MASEREKQFELEDYDPSTDALRLRVPRLAHFTVVLLVLLMATTLGWMALTEAKLVVRATGEIRSATGGATARDADGEVSSEIRGRVVEVAVSVGDAVRVGDTLLRIDTKALDHEIDKLLREIKTLGAELVDLERVNVSSVQRFNAAKRRAELELEREHRRLARAKDQQAVEIRLAKLAVEECGEKEARTLELARLGLVSEEGRAQVVREARKAREKLRDAELSLDRGSIEVLEQSVEVLERNQEVEQLDGSMKRRASQRRLDLLQASLVELRRQREQCVLRTSSDGVVTAAAVKVGDIVEAGKVGVVVTQQSDIVFEAVVANEDVAFLRDGFPTQIKLDAFPHQAYGSFNGVVAFISPDAEPGSSGVSRRGYRIKIKLDRERLGPNLGNQAVKLGMTGHAEIITGKESVLSLLLRQIRQSVSLG